MLIVMSKSTAFASIKETKNIKFDICEFTISFFVGVKHMNKGLNYGGEKIIFDEGKFMKCKTIRHFITITKHRHQVLRNAFHMGIFFFALHHDLSKYSFKEFFPSAKYYAGSYSPINNQRMENNYFSSVCQHHVRKNPHHWEYWTDFYKGHLLVKTMPFKWAAEYVCDTLSASKVYNGKAFDRKMPLEYFDSHSKWYYMSTATKEFARWCLEKYAESGWKELNKKTAKAKYDELRKIYPDVEVLDELHPYGDLPLIK